MKHKGWKIFFRNWLWHLLVIFLVVNIFDSIDFLVKVSIIGDYQKNSDGTPVTLFQRLIAHNFQRPDNFYFVVFTLVADLCWHFLFDRFKWPLFLLAMLAVSTVLVFSVAAMLGHIGQTNYFRTILSFAAYFTGYAFLRYFLRHRLYRLHTRLHHSQNELQILKQQLNPHFLFNSLNYLYGTAMMEKAPTTADGIQVLSELMRYTVTGVQETYVSLASELAFIKKYVLMHQLRLGNKSNEVLTIEISGSSEPLRIAPMLLIAFIENAFKYGLQNDESQYVNLQLHVIDDLLKLEVENSVPGNSDQLKGTNSGLSVTRKRLDLLYPGRYSLTTQHNEKRYKVLFEIRLR